MSKFRWLLLGSIVVVSTLAFAACGGGDDDDGDDGGDNTPAASETTSGGGDETVEAEPTEEEDGEGSGGNGEGDKDELLELGQAFLEATFQATYEVTSVGGAEITGVTIVKDGENLRFDITGDAEGQPIDATFITAGESSYLCFTGDFVQTLGFEGDGVCTESSADDPTNPVGSLTDEFEITEADLADTEILGREEREIAGKDAICYQTTSPDAGDSTVCISEDGVLLAVESADTTFSATEVSDDVSDSDFEPPYPVEELPF